MKFQRDMKRLMIITFSSFVLCSFGQTTETTDFKRFQVGVNFSPDVTYRILQKNGTDPYARTGIGLRNANEIPKFGYTTGINVCYNIKSFVGIETGIQYSNKGYQSKKMDLIFESDLDSLGWNYSGATHKFIEEFHYIDIPVKVNFTIGKKKVRFFTSVGLVTNILVQATYTSIVHENETTNKTTDKSPFDYSRVNLSPMLSVGIDYKINSKMNLRVEPTFRFGALKIIDTPITGYLYSGGVNVSYYFGL